jgi:SecD/SecF fusion protein
VTERRSHLILIAVIGLALVSALLLAIPGSPVYKAPRLGLDLQGGLEVVLKAQPEQNRALQESDVNRSLEIIRERVDKLGVAEPTITKQGEDQISVELPGIDNPESALEIIGKTAELQLFDLETALTGPSISAQGDAIPKETLYDLLADARTTSLRQRNGVGGSFYLFNKETKKLLAGPSPTREGLLAKRDGKVPKDGVVLAVPKEALIVECGVDEVVCPGVNIENPSDDYYYLFKYTPDAEELDERFPQMTGEDLRLSGTRADVDPTQGPIVLMQFTDDGGDKFEEITRAEWVRGSLRKVPQHFAIVLDGEIKSWPQINFEDPTLSRGIGGGSAQITGIDDLDEAKNIALVLQTGALPVEFRLLTSTEISATLGEDSLREALRAAIAGMIIVAIFLLVAYRFLGLVAVIGLAVYAAFLYAVVLLFNVTLTLPSFAGMILTIGVAADANIVIFERIREEVHAGKSVRAAISAGYSKGFNSIIDANVITALTAVVLFVLATAGVKGFALMLLLGTAMSIVTAVFATRAMLALLAGFRWFSSPRFMGTGSAGIPRWIQHDYIGKRNIWFAISGVVLLLSVGAIALNGLNLGIDFKGGTEIAFETSQPTTIEDVRAQAERFGQANAVIQGIGAESNGGYQEFQVRTEELTPREANQLEEAFQEELAATDFGTTTVSASFGEQIAESAIYAILFSLFLVTLWVTFRFQWKFALAVMIALVHDVLIATGIYSLSDREVTTATVAAILTVLGYSMYDTVIILDRVRENIPLMRRSPIAQIANVSLWETIRRSLATTFITLLPVTSLYFFGGETLKDFAFALLVGIGSGAYSSIFIAAPIVALLKEREPEYARRKAEGTLPGEEGGPLAKLRPRRPAGGPGPATDPDPALLTEATEAAAEQPAPPLAPSLEPQPAASVDGMSGREGRDAKRERRRQRRRTRPHGRAR